ncbi:RHOMBOID-like protein 2 [Vitis vinifera]|uniref:RHOMBOID-like protein n=1 Tax=Vitis vinifera TaxID=29760 RepID=A0A438GRE9_VITVI|nr:RHOMBOID-like protein 2 [Vitis vinifera]
MLFRFHDVANSHWLKYEGMLIAAAADVVVSSFTAAVRKLKHPPKSHQLLLCSLSLYCLSLSLNPSPTSPNLLGIAMPPSEDLESRGAKNRGGSYTSSSVIEDSETQWTSWLVPMFVVANVAVFVVAMYINNCPKENSRAQGKCVAGFLGRFSFQPLKENPLFGPSSKTLEKLGALEWKKLSVSIKDGGLSLASGYMLADPTPLPLDIVVFPFHIILFYFCSFSLELPCYEPHRDIVLAVRIGVIYLLSGFGGSVLSSLFIQNSISVGASGALFGLLGAMLSELITNWSMYTNRAAALLTLLVIVAVNLTVGILPRVNNFAHIGGFVTGFFLGFILMPRPQFGWIEGRNLPADVRVKSKYKAYQYVCWLVSLVLLIAGFTVGLVMLYKGKNGSEHCHWCHYLSCVPTSSWKCDETQF